MSRVTRFILQGALLVQDGGYMHTITPTLFPGIKLSYMRAESKIHECIHLGHVPSLRGVLALVEKLG